MSHFVSNLFVVDRLLCGAWMSSWSWYACAGVVDGLLWMQLEQVRMCVLKWWIVCNIFGSPAISYVHDQFIGRPQRIIFSFESFGIS